MEALREALIDYLEGHGNFAEVHHTAGEDCYLVKVRVADTEALGQFMREKVGVIDSVRSTRTTIVLETLKETGTLHIQLGPQEV